MGRKSKASPVTWETVRELVSALPGVEEGRSYGTPALRVRGKLFARLHQDGDALVIKIHQDERAALMKLAPETFYITEHYRCWPAMLVRLSTVDPDDLHKLLAESWRRCAPKRLVATYNGKS